MKLTDEDKQQIKTQFEDESSKFYNNISALAREYDVSRSYIRFIIYPEKLEKNRKQQRERRREERR